MNAHKTVLVIGGGPAGSTAAALMARAGFTVKLFERESFPRYHIGESLAPSCRAVLELSGAAEAVMQHGFQIKRGGLFRWGAEDWGVNWRENIGPEAYAWQVDRAEFDHLLLDNAREQGAQVYEGARVRRVLFTHGRPTGLEWSTADGDPVTEHADFVIDASGRSGILSTQYNKDRKAPDVFRNVAMWGYWRGGTTLPGSPEGGLNAISSPEGWYWVVPLADGRHSVGFVTHRENFRERRSAYDSVEDMLQDLVRESDSVRSLMEGGSFEPPARVEKDYSYAADRFSGPGYVILGDAACFLDPLLSSGTHLAMFSALIGAAAVTATLEGDVPEDAATEFFERQYRRAYRRFLKLVSLMYQQYQGKETYFWEAQRLDGGGARTRLPSRPFARIISGLSDLQDAGYVPGWSGDEAKRNTPGGEASLHIRGIADHSVGVRLVTSPWPTLTLLPEVEGKAS